jgi:hypothetical protein
MWTVVDYDDATVPTSLDTLLQYQNIKRTRMNQTHSRYFKPMVPMGIGTLGGIQALNAKRNVWLDCSNAAVDHYGLKLWFDTRGTAPVTYDVQVKYYLTFKNVR